MAYDQMTADLQRENRELESRLSAAEKERDEAKEELQIANQCQCDEKVITSSDGDAKIECSAERMMEEMRSLKAQLATLSHLRQQVRREALEEAAKLIDAKAQDHVREEMERIEADAETDIDPDDEDSWMAQAENAAKATGWTMLQCASAIRRLAEEAKQEGKNES